MKEQRKYYNQLLPESLLPWLSEVVENVLGDKRRIGSAKWLPTSGQKGTADISATIWGKSVKIEIKTTDRQSQDQKKYQEAVEKAGGVYLLVRDFTSFKIWFDAL